MRIGITGGIGSGKSTVSNYLKSKNYKIIDADEIARDIVKPGMPVLKRVVDSFGADVLDEKGNLRRKYLGKIVFGDKSKKELLDKIMLDEIFTIIIHQFNKNNDKIVFLDAPLLFEGGLNKEVDYVWVVKTNDQVRIKRVADRDSISHEDVELRINSQMAESKKIALADDIIDNSGTKEELYLEIDKVIKKYEDM